MEGGPVVGRRRFAVSAERRILVGVHGSLGSLQALRYAAEQARQAEGLLIAVVAWVPPGGDLAERRQPVYSLRQIWRDAARARLQDAFDQALGGLPADLAVERVVIRGPAGPGPGRRGRPARRPAGGGHRPARPAAVDPAFGQPVLPGPRALPGGGDPALRPDGGGGPGPAPVAAPGGARVQPPGELAPPDLVRLSGSGRQGASARRRSRAASRVPSRPAAWAGPKKA